MIQFTPTFSLTYKRKISIYTIPIEVIFNKIFPKANDPLCELATLIKKFGDQTNTKKLLSLFSENLLPLLHLSQTNKHFHAIFDKEIRNRTELNHVSCNSIVNYLDHHGRYTSQIFDLTYFDIKDDFYLSVSLVRQNKDSKKSQVYDQNDYINIHNVCTKILNMNSPQIIKDACTKLQTECEAMRNLSAENIITLQKFFLENEKYDDWMEFRKYGSTIKSICPTILQLDIICYNTNELKNIRSCLQDNENLSSIFSKCTSIPNDVLKYVPAYYSILQKLRPISDSESRLTYKIDYGFSNEPTIPVDILCSELLINECLSKQN